MDEGARRWLAKEARRQYWRVSAWYELEDVIQEGYYAYYYVIKHYPKAKDPAHRMSLFKLTFNSVMCNLANQRTKRISETCNSDMTTTTEDGTPIDFLSTVAADPDLAEAVAALTSAPQYVKDALALFTTPEGLRRLQYKSRRTGRGRRRRETLNERLCRLTGYDPARVDIVGGIRACLEG